MKRFVGARVVLVVVAAVAVAVGSVVAIAASAAPASGAPAQAQGRTAEIVATFTGVDFGGDWPGPANVRESYIHFQAETDGPVEQQEVIAWNDDSDPYDVELEGSEVQETAARRAMVDDIRDKMRSFGWHEIGVGEYWYSYRFTEQAVDNSEDAGTPASRDTGGGTSGGGGGGSDDGVDLTTVALVGLAVLAAGAVTFAVVERRRTHLTPHAF